MVVENPHEQVQENTEKTPDQLADDLYNLLTWQEYAFDQLANFCKNIIQKGKAEEVQSKLNIKKENESDPNKKNQYATLIEIINDFINFNRETVPATQQSATEIRVWVENNNESIIDETCLTFKLYNGLNLNTIKDDIIQKVNGRKDPELSGYFKDFKTLNDENQKTEKMKEIQRYLNKKVQPNPPLTIDGKFWRYTYDALTKLQPLQISVRSGATNGEWNPETQGPTPIEIKESDIPNTLKLYGRRNIPPINRNELITACNKDNIPNEAKQKIKEFFKTTDISWLQTYLNELLNTTITSWPYIDRQEFAAELARNYPGIPTDPDQNWFDWNDKIKPDGFLWPQTLIAISCIKEKQPESDLNNNQPDNSPEVPEDLPDEEKQTKIKEQITKGLWEEYDTNNIDFSQLNDNKIGLTFKETVEWEEEEKVNKIIFDWKEGTLQFEGCNKILQIWETLKIDKLRQELTDKTDNNLPKYRTFEFAASLWSLLSKTKAKKCKWLYYCTYDEGDKNIKIHSLSYDEYTKQITSTDSELFEKGDNNVNQLTQLNTDFKLNDTLTKQETQENIAKFMTLNIDKTQDHWNEAKQEIQKDILYKNENFD